MMDNFVGLALKTKTKQKYIFNKTKAKPKSSWSFSMSPTLDSPEWENCNVLKQVLVYQPGSENTGVAVLTCEVENGCTYDSGLCRPVRESWRGQEVEHLH